MRLTITKKRFLEWYFESGQDQENEELKLDLANYIIGQMYKFGIGSMSVEEIFNKCNKEAIRVSFTEQGTEDDYDTELSDLDSFDIELI